MCDNPSPLSTKTLGATWETTTNPMPADDKGAGEEHSIDRVTWGHAGVRVVLVAMIAFLTLGGIEAWKDSATFDEPVYVSSGVAAVLHHDLADNAEHPPLFKVLAAIPVLAMHPVVPPDGHWDTNNERAY